MHADFLFFYAPSNDQRTIKGQGAVFNHSMNHQGNLYGLKIIKRDLTTRIIQPCRDTRTQPVGATNMAERSAKSNCPTRQGNSYGLLNRQGIACNAAMHALDAHSVCLSSNLLHYYNAS